MATSPLTPTRRPYKGSCHCGKTKYIAYLTLPPPLISTHPPSPSSTIRIRKCNCSTCHKMSFLHVRLMDTPNDFILLSPLNPTSGGLLDYTCYDHRIHWYFCGTCGVRCFAFGGEGVVREVEVDGKKKEVWTPKSEGWKEGGWREARGTRPSYLSINGHTLEPGQEGLNLKEWTEKRWITYLDMKDEVGADRFGEPYDGGVY